MLRREIEIGAVVRDGLVSGRADGLALEPLIVDLAARSRLSGTGSFDLALSGRGRTVTQNLRQPPAS